MTQAEWLEQIEACGGDMSQDQLVNLLFEQGPNALWEETVRQMHVMNGDGLYNYLSGFFPTEVWEDWKGTTELGTTYHSPFIPFDASIFQRSMQICSPSSANECHTDYCTIPRGGITNLPELEMYKAGFKTERMCIANIRTSKRAKQIAQMFVKERFAVDERVMEIFFTLAVIRMLGHKTVLEYANDGAGNVQLIDNDNPYNPLQGGRFSYMQPLFPAAGNLENIMPLDMRFLDQYGTQLATARDSNFIARGPRGEPIYELWTPGDWYRQEKLDNEDYIEKSKFTVTPQLLPGYRYSSAGEKEIVGNFSIRQMDALPRFTESTEGGLTIVEPWVNTPVDNGNRATPSYRDYVNAPFYLVVMLGKNVGHLLSRPDINTGIEDRPIMPITGGVGSEWRYRNDYDKDCNPDLNMPYLQKRYEMGFRMDNPDAGRGFLVRAKKFRQRPVQTCDLRPIFKATPSKMSCSITTIGCNPLNDRLSNNIMDDSMGFRKVKCSAKVCGDSTNRIYRLDIRRESIDAINPDENPLQNCACGDTVTVFIGNSEGETVKQRDAVIIEYIRPNMVNPNPVYFVNIASVLADGECIQSIGCKDSTPTVSTVMSCNDNSDDDTIAEGSVKFVVDSPIPCNVGADVEIKYYNDANTLLDTIDGVIESINVDLGIYVISSEEVDFGCDFVDGATRVTINCA